MVHECPESKERSDRKAVLNNHRDWFRPGRVTVRLVLMESKAAGGMRRGGWKSANKVSVGVDRQKNDPIVATARVSRPTLQCQHRDVIIVV